MAIRQDFTLWRGTAVAIECTVYKPDGTLEDVTNWTGVLTLRVRSADDDPPALSVSMTVVNGKLRAVLAKSDTLTISAGRYGYTIERNNPGNEDVVTWGVCTVRLDVVNAA